MNEEILISAFRKASQRFRSLGKMAWGADEAEDALQDAFCRLWTRRADIKGDRQAEGLLLTTSRNLRIDYARKRQTHPESSIEDIGEARDTEHEETEVEEIYRKIDSLASDNLSERDREILYLRDKDGWEFDDIAQRFELSESNVRLIVSRARKVLRNLYRGSQ